MSLHLYSEYASHRVTTYNDRQAGSGQGHNMCSQAACKLSKYLQVTGRHVGVYALCIYMLPDSWVNSLSLPTSSHDPIILIAQLNTIPIIALIPVTNVCILYMYTHYTVLWSRSRTFLLLEPEPVKMNRLRLRAVAVWLFWWQSCDNSYNFSQITTIFTQIERKKGKI